jgi:hypothetical protein
LHHLVYNQRILKVAYGRDRKRDVE